MARSNYLWVASIFNPNDFEATQNWADDAGLASALSRYQWVVHIPRSNWDILRPAHFLRVATVAQPEIWLCKMAPFDECRDWKVNMDQNGTRAIWAIWAMVKIGLCNHIWSFLGVIILQFWHPRQAEIDGGFPKQSFVKLGILHYHRETHMYFWLFGVAGSVKIYWKTLCLESPYQTPENHATVRRLKCHPWNRGP